MNNPGFENGASPTIRRRIEQALRVRTRFPLAREVPVDPLIPDPDWDIRMEIIGLEGMYRALLVAVKGGEVKMLTNLTLKAPRDRAFLGPQGARLVPTHVLSQSLADDIGDQLHRLRFADGGGGDEEGLDGDVYFLTISSPGKVTFTALYFYQYPATAYRWDVPGGIDEPRWQAIKTIYEIWRDILTNPVGGPNP